MKAFMLKPFKWNNKPIGCNPGTEALSFMDVTYYIGRIPEGCEQAGRFFWQYKDLTDYSSTYTTDSLDAARDAVERMIVDQLMDFFIPVNLEPSLN